MDYQFDWKVLLEKANEELSKYGTEIKVIAKEYRRNDILIVKKDREAPVIFAEDVGNSDLSENIEGALSSAILLIGADIKKRSKKENLHTYREINDREACLFMKHPSYPLFFLLPDDSIESVSELSEFENREGTFVCREQDYEPAMILAEEHEDDA